MSVYIYTVCVFAWTDTGKDCDVKKVLFIAHLWHLSFLYLYRCQVKGLLIAGEKIIYLDNQIPSPHAIDMGGIVSLWYQKLLRCFKLRIHAMYMWKRKRQVGFIYPSSCTRLPNAHVYKLCRKFAQQWNERCIIILVPYFCTPQYSLYRYTEKYIRSSTVFEPHILKDMIHKFSSFPQWQVKNQFNKMKWQNPGPYLYSSHCVTVLIISFNWNYDSPQKSPTETYLM